MSPQTILLVDDEEEFRFSLGLILRRAGYTVLEAEHGIKALNILAKHAREHRPVDLLITDIRMPCMNGPELLDAMTRKGLFTRIIMMTGYDYSFWAGPLRNIECEKILEKPFDAQELLQEVARVLAARPEQGDV